MIEINVPAEADLRDAQQRFAEMSQQRVLLADIGIAAGEMFSAGRLYRHATAVSPAPDPSLSAALLAKPAMRRAYREFVSMAAMYRPGIAAAASTAEFPMRHAPDCRISVEPSQAEPDQFIVIIEFDKVDKEAAATTLVLCDLEDNCHRFPLPAAHRGVIQFIVVADDPILTLLRDPGVEALLR